MLGHRVVMLMAVMLVVMHRSGGSIDAISRRNFALRNSARESLLLLRWNVGKTR